MQIETALEKFDDLIRSTVRDVAREFEYRGSRDDVEQECRLQLIRQWPKFDQSRGAVGPFVKVTTKHAARDAFEKFFDDFMPTVANDRHSAVDQCGATNLESIAETINRNPERFLPPNEASVFRLLRRGQSHKEIAVTLFYTRGYVANLACSIRKRLLALSEETALAV